MLTTVASHLLPPTWCLPPGCGVLNAVLACVDGRLEIFGKGLALRGAMVRLGRRAVLTSAIRFFASQSGLVGLACFLSAAVASNLPPVFVSPVWPTNAILLCVLVVTPVRDWWAYAIAGFFSSVNHNTHTGAPIFQIVIFLVADSIEVFSAAIGVCRFAGGLRAFETLATSLPI